MLHKNFKNIDRVTYGRGAISQLAETIAPKRTGNTQHFVFVIDAWFEGKDLESKFHPHAEDLIYYIDVDPHEPTTEQIDRLRDEVLRMKGLPAGVVGIGGG